MHICSLFLTFLYYLYQFLYYHFSLGKVERIIMILIGCFHMFKWVWSRVCLVRPIVWQQTRSVPFGHINLGKVRSVWPPVFKVCLVWSRVAKDCLVWPMRFMVKYLSWVVDLVLFNISTSSSFKKRLAGTVAVLKHYRMHYHIYEQLYN